MDMPMEMASTDMPFMDIPSVEVEPMEMLLNRRDRGAPRNPGASRWPSAARGSPNICRVDTTGWNSCYSAYPWLCWCKYREAESAVSRDSLRPSRLKIALLKIHLPTHIETAGPDFLSIFTLARHFHSTLPLPLRLGAILWQRRSKQQYGKSASRHSPDSDDAFMFYVWPAAKFTVPGYEFTHTLTDIETLNQRAMREAFYDVTAISFQRISLYPEKIIR